MAARVRHLKPEWNRPWTAMRLIVAPLVGSVVRLDIRHPERVPAEGAFIATPNHMTDFDPVVVGYTLYKLGRVPRFLAKASLFSKPVLGPFLRGLGQIPVERGMRGANPLEAAGDLLDRGWGVIIYPEGTLTRDPDLWPMRGKTGAVRAALEEGVPLVPIAHWGAQRILPRWSKRIHLFPRHTVQVLIGEEFDLGPWRGRPLTRELLDEATDALMDEIARLLADLRGGMPPDERWDPAAHGQSEYGRP